MKATLLLFHLLMSPMVTAIKLSENGIFDGLHPDFAEEVPEFEVLDFHVPSGRREEGKKTTLQGLKRWEAPGEEGHPEDITLHFYALARNWTIKAIRNIEFFKTDYKEVYMTPEGNIHHIKEGVPMCHYQGRLKEHDSSSVFLSTCRGGIEGILEISGSVYEVQYNKDKDRHIMFNFKHYKPKKPFHCNVEEDDHPHSHGEHRHSHSHSHQRKILSANTCTSGETLTVSHLIVNDLTRFQRRGKDVTSHSASIFAYVYYYYYGGTFSGSIFQGVYRTTAFPCRVAPRLTGQITYHTGNPSQIDYAFGNQCSQYESGTCSATEVSSSRLLRTLSNNFWRDFQSTLDTIFGDIDNVSLFTEENFAGSTIGLAWLSRMCSNSLSANINQMSFSSVFYNAQIVAHEIGHNFGMSHDPNSGFVMYGVASSTIRTDFSPASISDIDTFISNLYGVPVFPSIPTCLETDPGVDGYLNGACGNGIVDSGEDCDPGVLISTTCCNSDCTRSQACIECDPAEVCCGPDGRFLDSSNVCRSAVSSSCDFVEYCTGRSGECPTDLFSSPGTICPSTSPLGVNEEGLCFKGSCVSRSSNCRVTAQSEFRFGSSATNNPADICSQVACKNNVGSSINAGIALAGTPCGANNTVPFQCQATSLTCRPSDVFKEYHWNTSDAGCGSIFCVDEEASVVNDLFCVTSKPNSTTCPPTSAPSQNGEDTSNAGVIAGAVIGTLVGVAAIIAVAYYFFKHPPNLKSFKFKSFNFTSQPKPIPVHSKVNIASSQASTGVKKLDTRNRQISTTPLPIGWTEHYDDGGMPYYYNAATGESMWERPGQAV